MPPPDRWTDYRPLGSVIPGTKFIAFKVPLKEALCRNLSADERFSPSRLIQILKESGQDLGLVVDLTFTSKYYNGKEFSKKSIDYEKIFTAGHEIPSEKVFQRFEEIVSDFCAKNADNNILIGIHCTHGVNRTGYLVCRYMIEKLNFQPDDAISKFNEARGHPIERENYLEDLRKRPFERPLKSLKIPLHLLQRGKSGSQDTRKGKWRNQQICLKKHSLLRAVNILAVPRWLGQKPVLGSRGRSITRMAMVTAPDIRVMYHHWKLWNHQKCSGEVAGVQAGYHKYKGIDIWDLIGYNPCSTLH
ncbi:hypothetical protein C0Q70_09808 [Pomacea canaliculata]|uniref:Uncharacterized protein n=1 Tax=Pomacea canaliculata TaxID=400727 RepID=A0A2T7PAU2_POMCA|nr:RNA/RNP complex-1-interacting phosphatase-like [Pomacea canaliculata]PVD30540.1 hypothetical protein C0Q70_09808 [Pomacea canaliculata]